MEGRVRKITDKGFGFIKGENGEDIFFHRDDFNGHWADLHDDFNNDMTIRVQFESKSTPKGLRASNVRRLDYPNQG